MVGFLLEEEEEALEGVSDVAGVFVALFFLLLAVAADFFFVVELLGVFFFLDVVAVVDSLLVGVTLAPGVKEEVAALSSSSSLAEGAMAILSTICVGVMRRESVKVRHAR